MAAPSTFIARVARLGVPAPDFPRRLFFPASALDKAALGLVAVVFLAFAFFHEGLSLKSDSDQYYHMAAARRTLELGHIPKWDDWEFAPAGRPHLYPPGLHLALAVLAGRPDRLPAAPSAPCRFSPIRRRFWRRGGSSGGFSATGSVSWACFFHLGFCAWRPMLPGSRRRPRPSARETPAAGPWCDRSSWGFCGCSFSTRSWRPWRSGAS